MIPLLLLLAHAHTVEAIPQATSTEPRSALARAPGKVSADHDRLDALSGRFHFERTTTAVPGRPAERATGWSENRWILGDSYLECRLREAGTATDEAAVVTYGFDLRRRSYFVLAVATRGTSYLNLEGFWDEPTRSLVLLGKDSGDGKTPSPKLRMILRIENRDRHVVELWVIVTGRLPQKFSETVFTRE